MYNVCFKRYILSTLDIPIKSSNITIFGPIFTKFSPKCKALNVLIEKGHRAMEKRAWRYGKGAWCSTMLKWARGNTKLYQ